MTTETLETAAELEKLLLRELRAEYKRLNASYFKDALRVPAFELSLATSFLGRWHRGTRTIELTRGLVTAHGWGVVVEVLKHEMAHQYVHEVLRETDESAHGPAFRKICERLGVDPAASGAPSATVANDHEERLVARVARLLALAGSPNQHEAEAAMAAAQRLMLKYNLTERASGHTPYAWKHLGTPTGRTSEHERLLALILQDHFFVDVIWVPVFVVWTTPRQSRERAVGALAGKRASVLEICGTPGNLAMAEYVHAYLMHAADRCWIAHKKLHAMGNKDRRTYLAGVMTGFYETLKKQAQTQKKEGLVWVKDADLSGYYRRRHPYVRNVRYGGNARTESYAHGKEAGARIVIHRPLETTARGKLLPARS